MSAILTTTGEFSEVGDALLDLARRAAANRDPDANPWKDEWKAPEFALGAFGSCWRSAPTWRVDDFAAELGFLVGGLGFDVNAVAAEVPSEGAPYAMLIAPDGVSTFAFYGATADAPAIDPRSLTLEFMLADVRAAFDRCVERGVEVVREPWMDDSMLRASLRSPAGIEVSLWQDPTLR